MAKTLKAPTVTRRELAGILSVHPMTITKWEREGLPIAKRGRRGKASLYVETDVRAWLSAREEAAKAPGAPMDLAQERARKERWQGLLSEQTYLLRQKDLLPADDVAKAWAAENAAVRTIILASYTMHADRVHRAATLEGVAGVERCLKAIAYEVLRELADETRPTGVGKPTRTKRSAAA